MMFQIAMHHTTWVKAHATVSVSHMIVPHINILTQNLVAAIAVTIGLAQTISTLMTPHVNANVMMLQHAMHHTIWIKAHANVSVSHMIVPPINTLTKIPAVVAVMTT